ncbi:MAG: spermidine/putrescine ABC transporter ATP-binding protein [Candidatus Rokuibacteriota bacterium]|nr:MAG: spermidine/putrescine ABC transporter ATP-binding protein [Candidatus Rokubacteria bacterium]
MVCRTKGGRDAGFVSRDAGAEIEFRSVTRTFGDVIAVRDVSLRVAEGEFVTLLGPSGSGKTTLLMMLAGFLVPTGGDIRINGASVVLRPAHKRDLGIVFQHYALFPHLSVFDNVAFPLRLRRMSGVEIRTSVERLLELVRLPGLAARRPRELSGGQQQRVALARALVFNPSALLMDEPLGALDRKLRAHMQEEIRDIQRSLRITTLYVTHDQDEAMTMSDRIAVLNEGRLEQVAGPAELYARPANAFVADFLGDANFLRATVVDAGAGQLVAVTGGGLRVTVTATRPAGPGQELVLVLRPEALRLLAAGESDDNCHDGVVEGALFLGGLTRVRIRAGKELLTLATTRTPLSGHVRTGDSVRLGWSADAVVAIPGDSPPPSP